MTRRLNLLTDVTGIGVGHADDEARGSGVTAICCAAPMLAAAHCCGGAPATRETDLLYEDGLVERIDAVLLCGGSAFGLAAADGALEALEKHNRGFATRTGRVPIVPAAALFDLFETTSKRADYRSLGRHALERAHANFAQDFALGNVGAGRGARAGEFKGGVGSASATFSRNLAGDSTTSDATATNAAVTVGALAVVNAFGSPAYADLSALRAWWLEQDDEFGGLAPAQDTKDTSPAERMAGASSSHRSALLADKKAVREHTTLCLIAFDCALSKSALKRIAKASTSALAIALHPSQTLFDGDIVFALSTASSSESSHEFYSPAPSPAFLQACEQHACETLARAIAKGVWYGESTPCAQSFCDARRERDAQILHRKSPRKKSS